ncbi:hypothetical protein VTO42DRAFT_3126 [Malbranchea cinnamomea]
MFKTTTSISITTPVPLTISRAALLAILHDHQEMIKLNPLVVQYQPCSRPPSPSRRSSSSSQEEAGIGRRTGEDEENERTAGASSGEMEWYRITDEILPYHFLPFSRVVYTAGFRDAPDGLHTRTYAPMGLRMEGRWTVGPREEAEEGGRLYLTEEVRMTCSWLTRAFVQRALKKSHAVLTEKLIEKAAKSDV